MREATTRILEQMAPWCWRELADLEGWPLETRLRAKGVADRHWPLVPLADRQAHVAGFKPHGWSYLPWLCLALGSHHLAGRASSLGCWQGHRDATADWLKDAAETMLPAAILSELERMAVAEDDWVATNPHAYTMAGGQRRHAR